MAKLKDNNGLILDNPINKVIGLADLGAIFKTIVKVNTLIIIYIIKYIKVANKPFKDSVDKPINKKPI